MVLLSGLLLVRAQGQTTQSSAISPSSTAGSQSPSWSVTSRQANQRVWQRTSYDVAPGGRIIPHSHQVIELATGLCYQDGSGKFVDSSEQIDILPDGTAAATRGQHQAYFPGDIYNGAVISVTPDGRRLQSRPLGLSYDDGTNIVLIAVLTNSIGELVSSNRVIYPNAFDGATASLRYTYKKSGLEQDVVVRGRLPAPQSFGLNPQTTRLQVLTEFFGTNTPIQTTTGTSPQDGLSDTTLAFGKMKMARGRAFSIGITNQPDSLTNRTPTYKSWQRLNGRNFLVEAVPYRRIAQQLNQLPASVAANAVNTNAASGNSILNKVSAKRLLPESRMVQTTPERIQLAKTDSNIKPSVVLDYVEVDDDQDGYDFQWRVTYYITSPIFISGTTTIEGGSVIKYAPGASLTVQSLIDYGGMAYLTARDDDTMGEILPDSTHTPSGFYADTALETDQDGDMAIANVQVSYANTALKFFGTGYVDHNVSLSDSVLWNCGTGVDAEAQGEDGNMWLSISNVRMQNVGTPFYGAFIGGTVDSLILSDCNGWLANDVGYGGNTLYFSNCKFANCTYWGGSGLTIDGDYNYFHNSPGFGSDQQTLNVGTPSAGSQLVGTPPNTPVSIVLQGSDPNNNPLTYVLTGSPSYGTLTGTPPNLVYEPNPGFTGLDSLTFVADNGILVSSNTTVTIAVTAPLSQSVATNDTVTFSVISGLKYQWKFNGTNISTATNSSYTIGNVRATNAGNYTVKMSLGANSATSAVAQLVLTPMRLAYWPFADTNAWTGSAGQAPLMFTNIVGIPSWATNAMLMDIPAPAFLNYRDVETNGNLNIGLRSGTVRLWFSPDWSSANEGGGGPGNSGRLIELGNNAPDFITNSWVVYSTNSWWALCVSPDGNQLAFGCTSNGLGGINLTVPISWASGDWHQVVLTYTSSNSLLYVDGQLQASGTGSINFLNGGQDVTGFRIGSDVDGANQAGGVFDELEIFNYPLSAASIWNEYTNCLAFPPAIIQQPANQTIYLDGTDITAILYAWVWSFSPVTYQWQHDGTNIFNSIITTVAGHYYDTGGGGEYSGDGGKATEAYLYGPSGVAVDVIGNLYIADTYNDLIRKVDTNGIITTVAGDRPNGGKFAGDGEQATNASLSNPMAVALDISGNLYIADANNNVIRKVDTNGIITTVAGDNSNGGTYGGDGGSATSASLAGPNSVALDARGNLYIADTGNGRIREVGTNGIIETIAGGGSPSDDNFGDGLPATLSSLANPNSVAVDAAGNVYIADETHSRIRKVDTNGIISTVAGGGSPPDGVGDGLPATQASLLEAASVTVDSIGNLYITDGERNIIRKVGTDGIITTVAGRLGYSDYFGDGGSATNAGMNSPVNVAADAAGNLYIADAGVQVIRKVTFRDRATLILPDLTTNDTGSYQVIVTSPNGTLTSSNAALTVLIAPPTIVEPPVDQTVLVGGTANFNISASGYPPLTYQWRFHGSTSPYNGTNILGATNVSYSIIRAQTNQTGYYSVIVSNQGGWLVGGWVHLSVNIAYVPLKGSLTNYMFKGDTTYYVNSTVQLYGTTTIEGGTVIKFSTNGSLNVLGPLVCETGPYHPAVLTSKDDDSVGLMIDHSSGNPNTASNGLPYLNLAYWSFSQSGIKGPISTNADVTVRYLRFAYAYQGIAATCGFSGNISSIYITNDLPIGYVVNSHVWDCQFVKCVQGFANSSWNCAGVADLHNVLFSGCQYSLAGSNVAANYTFISGEQITSDSGSFWNTNHTLNAVSLTNSIILGNFQFLPSTSVTTNNVVVNPGGTIFQTVGGANYYLATNTLQNMGSTNISAEMRLDLNQKTTWPPIFYTSAGRPSSENLYFFPQASRDTNSAPDLGYHYDPLDYLFGAEYKTYTTVTLNPGTAIGTYGTNGFNYGIAIGSQTIFASIGSPVQMNEIAEYNTVQEQAVPSWNTCSNASIVCLGGSASLASFKFTDWSSLAQDCVHLWTSGSAAPVNLRDCQFHGGQIISSNLTINFTNCLLERVNCNLAPADTNTPVCRNNFFYGGTFAFYPAQTNAVLKDNLFDQTIIPDGIGALGNSYDGGHNAYVANCNQLDPGFPSDIVLTNSLAYSAGPLGSYYQPTNSPLIFAGSLPAGQMGLYHYTVSTNEIVDGTNNVSVGFHYLATDVNGNPLDSDGDGIPDYIEDANGNGIFDAGDFSDWTDFYNGQLPYMWAYSGDGQNGPLNAYLPSPLIVQVCTYFGILTNAPITFSVTNGLSMLSATTNGGPLTSNLVVRSDVLGEAKVYVFLPTNAPATNFVTALAQSGANTTRPVIFTCYEGQVDTPVVDPAGGASTVMRNVTVSCANSNAVIHYTINGNDPTETDPALTNGQSLLVPWPMSVRVDAFEDGILLPSDVQTVGFNLIHPLVTGRMHTLVLRPEETILAGGSNGSGQLGDGTTTDRTNLVGVLTLTTAAGVAAGAMHSLAWTTNGSAWTWGDDSYGQLGDGSSSGQRTSPYQITSLSNIVAMAGGSQHSLALASNGVVWAWGNNTSGQLGISNTTQHTTPVKVVGLSNNIVAIAGGGLHSLALGSDEIVRAWGDNTYGQIGDGSTTNHSTPARVSGLTNAVEIAGGYSHSLALAADGRVWAWGYNNYGQIGDGSTTNHTTLVQVHGLSNIVAIAAGEYHNLALAQNGTVWSWGYNSHGQIGDGTITTRTTPVQVTGLSNVLAIAAGWAHSAALKTDGTVVIWGSTNYGLNGDSSTDFSTSPVTAEPTVDINWNPPTIIVQPMSQSVFENDTVTFTVEAVGTNLTYQWTFDGNPIPGATASSYTIDAVWAYNIGNYAVVVGTGLNSVISSNAFLSVYMGTGTPWAMMLFGQHVNYTFKSGVTYIVWSPVQLYGTTTIEGGTVIKYYYPSSNATVQVIGSINCKTEPYFPAFLTSVDDDTVGDYFNMGYGPQAYFNGTAYLDLTQATNVSLSNLRIAYADQGVITPASGLDIWDCQFLECNSAIEDWTGGTNRLHNVLFANCGYAIEAYTNSFKAEAEQVTADVIHGFCNSSISPTLYLTNSIILSGGSDSALAGPTVVVNPSSTNFQASGAGYYYLAPESQLHQAGTANISPRLAAEFQNRTTYAPLAFPAFMPINGDLTLMQQVPRYTNGAPDLGYYYAALDYTFAGSTNFGNITVLPGTAVGWREEKLPGMGIFSGWTIFGLYLREGSTLISHGTPNRPNVFVDSSLIQEQFEFYTEAGLVPGYESQELNPPSMDFRFSNLYASPEWYHLWSGYDQWMCFVISLDSVMNWTMRDCNVHGGCIDLGPPLASYIFDPMIFASYGSGSVAWTNNLFDSVDINLNPSFIWVNDEATNCDLSFNADHNLFRNAKLFDVNPIPTSTGNWVFVNNLFENVDIFQNYWGDAQPLDFDYNAYWSPPVDALYWTGSHGQLLPVGGNMSGTNDVILTDRPTYLPGCFGSYYLPTNTPLYGAGSDTAANLGLYHYTTRADQFKEGDEQSGHKVNIGLHYIAATNCVPIDIDSDGIPDYVENWHGDGIRNHTDETDWQNPMTDNATNDTYNSVYDDVDLSGDGLVGRIKKALEMNPLDSSTPLTLARVFTGEEPDIATFEVPISYDILTNIGWLHINVDGMEAAFYELDPATNGQCLLKWNTTYDSPGLHYLSARLELGGSWPDTAIFSAQNTVMPFNSTNVLRFFESDTMFDDAGAYLDAQLPEPNANYTIQLYDPSTSPPTYIKAITNSTSNGMIQEDWNLTYDDGVTVFTGDTVTAVFNVTLLDPATGKHSKTLHKLSSNEQGNGFDFIYMYMPTNDALLGNFGIYSGNPGDVYSAIQSVVDTLLTPVRASGGHDDHYDSSFNRYTGQDFPQQPGIPGYVNSRSTITNSLYSSMADGTTKNFYCWAHGNPGGQNGKALTDYKGDVYMTSAEVAKWLGNHFHSVGGLWAANPYRFVFLDGCSTMDSKDWRRAFGIFPLDTPNRAGRNRVGAQAYVGWEKEHAAHFATADLAKAYAQTLNRFYGSWLAKQPLAVCLQQASDPHINQCPLAVPGNEFVKDINGNLFHGSTSKIYVSGHSGLTRDNLNQAYDNYTLYVPPTGNE